MYILINIFTILKNIQKKVTTLVLKKIIKL